MTLERWEKGGKLYVDRLAVRPHHAEPWPQEEPRLCCWHKGSGLAP